MAGRLCTGEPFIITDDVSVYRNSIFPKINYSAQRLVDAEIWIKPHGLLSEKGTRHQEIECSIIDGLPVFFQNESDLGFDILAASFYLVSRYEEYLPHHEDIYGRYGHEGSLAFKNGFLDQPLVNKWMKKFRDKAGLPDPGKFEFLPTYDIDEAWSYLHKTWIRSTGGLLRDLIKGDWQRVALRKQVISGKVKDPYDSFQWMDQLHEKYGLSPVYFFLLAANNGKYDKNQDPSDVPMKELVAKIAAKYKVGIHPSWQSGDRTELLSQEIHTLEKITLKRIDIARRHFLRFNLPEGYRRLIGAGIKEDHSMGYGTINGFRASIASSFYWYDLEKEETTDLLIHPFCFMDANAYYEQRQTTAQTKEELEHYLQEVRSVNGKLITLWHNTFLGEEPRFSGWKELYEQFVSAVSFEVG